MNISLDYDDTYTKDPVLWKAFIEMAHKRGHSVHVVTMRYEGTDANDVIFALGEYARSIIFTGRQLKKPFVDKLGLKIDIWIDDSPHYIVEGVPLF